MREISNREQRIRQQEGNDLMMEVEIINKETGEIVERKTDYADAATHWAKQRIWGKTKYLKYKTYQMQPE